MRKFSQYSPFQLLSHEKIGVETMEILTALIKIFAENGYVAVFGILVLCGFGLPVPEDVSLVAGGVISGLGYANAHYMFAVGMAGVLFGDVFVFSMGYYFGERILRFKPIGRVMTPERFAKVQEKFEKFGQWVVFFGRFMPGLRMPIFLSAGISKKISYSRFLLTDGFAALISVPIWVYLGNFFAKNLDELLVVMHKGQMTIFILLGIAICAFFIYHFFIKKKINEVL